MFYPVAEQVLEADHERGPHSGLHRLINDVLNADLTTVGEGLHRDSAIAPGMEVTGAPTGEAIEVL